jgi:exopolyphosphatase/guanosine-5'-triphosphate,3'-diphosphate pyrophosphatase
MTDAIVPRWEWRTFDTSRHGDRDDDLDAAWEQLDAAPSDKPTADSDEIYLVSSHSDASVKLRDGVMDVKTLQDRSADDLELWKPVLKAPFTLDADALGVVLGALGVGNEVRAVPVHKHREHFNIDGCMVERTEMRTATEAVRTIAIESPDAALVTATIAALGLTGRRNTCVARGLKALTGFGLPRYAIIDCGTNSIKFHVAARGADGTFRTLVDRSDITRLGEGIDETGGLVEAGIRRTVDAIIAMVDEARAYGVAEIVAVGTAGLRMANNSAALVDEVRDRTGVTIEIISGEEEGRLAYLAAVASLPVGRGSLAVYDSGGGSSQFSFGSGTHVDERFSVNVGAVRFTERFGLDRAVDPGTLHAALDAVAGDLDRLDGRAVPDAIVGLGGTSTNLAAVQHGLAEYDADIVHGTVLTLADIDHQIEEYRTRDADARRRDIVGLQPARAEVILAGACIVRTIITKLGKDSVTISDRGLRHGVLADRFGAR